MSVISVIGGTLPPSVFLPGEYTVDTLPTPSAANVDLYARVTDLFGVKRDLVLCSQVGGQYFWQPIRPTFARSISADQSLTLVPLKTPSVLFLGGSPLTAQRNYALSDVNAYPGASFEIAMDVGLGLFGLNITGLLGGATLAMLLNGRRRVFYDADAGGWKQF